MVASGKSARGAKRFCLLPQLLDLPSPFLQLPCKLCGADGLLGGSIAGGGLGGATGTESPGGL